MPPSGPRARLALMLISLAFVACSSAASDADPVSRGQAFYSSPIPDGNTFRCATCHALAEPAPDGIVRAGHPIGDALDRPSWKGGAVNSFRAAVNTCVTEWMNAEALADGDPRWGDLEAFLQSQNIPSGGAITIQRVDPPAAVAGGEASRGNVTYDRTCTACHGPGGAGTRLAPPLAGGDYEPGYIAERVRRSGRADSPTYPGLTGGIMPFWGADRLSDAELIDVIAYVRSIGASGQDPDAGVAMDAGNPGSPDSGIGGCGSSHPRVGSRGTLSRFAHGVGGTVRVVDDCTIEIEDFEYDGRGIDVRVYGALGRQFDQGFAISRDLIRAAPYRGERLRFTLPAGRTLDSLDSVSIWCVDVGVSFGDTLLR